jgi:arylsulfatase A-like enzyme
MNAPGLRLRYPHLTRIAIGLLLSLALGVVASGQSRQPNIIVILGDEIGYADVGFHGCQDIPTPHLDALAASGVRCSSGYVSAPVCSPTRAGLMTGRYQQRFGHENNLGPGERGLPLTEVTLADMLSGAG